MNRTFTLCFLLYPIALPFGYVLVYTFYHYAVPDANSDLKYLNGGYSARITRIKNIQINDYYIYIDLDTNDLPVDKKLSEYPMILVTVNTNTVAEPILYADRAGDRKIRVVFAGTITGTINLCLQYSVSPV